jgi:aspartyl-tRNA(Asn)/glutamyl-tRNA(Gln) amidotransferase subunit A
MKRDANLADATLTQAAGLLREGQASSDDLLQACVAQIEQLNPLLRAFLHTRLGAAHLAADNADRALASSGWTSLLTGIPLAHKDMFSRANELSTFGAHPSRSERARFTATVKARLDQNLALDLGGLHMSEYAAGPTGGNVHHGRCLNPWAIDRLCGGSSSGSAVAVAARMIYGSLGSDTGGSIRIPAALCGVTGLKPTFGRVSRHGVMPRVWSQDCVGPIARNVDDCAIIFAAILGPDGLDPLLVNGAPEFEWPARGLNRKFRIGVLDMPEHADRDVEKCIEQAVLDLRNLGHSVGVARWSGMADVQSLAETAHKAEASAIHDIYLREDPESYDKFVRARFEEGLMIPAVRYLQAQSMRPLMAREFVENVLGQFDVVILPTVGCQAPLAAEVSDDSESGRTMLGKLTAFTRAFSYLGLPALTVPCGFGDAGVPVGLQIVGRPFAESTVLAVGQAYQKGTPWHTERPTIDLAGKTPG